MRSETNECGVWNAERISLSIPHSAFRICIAPFASSAVGKAGLRASLSKVPCPGFQTRKGNVFTEEFRAWD